MVCRLLGWGVVGGTYYMICRLFHVLVQKLHVITELVHRLRNILSFYEVGGYTGVYIGPLYLILLSIHL